MLTRDSRRIVLLLSALCAACATLVRTDVVVQSSRASQDALDLPPILLPVVVHYGGSRVWSNTDSIRRVMMEVQRIFDQARIILRVSVVNDTLATDSMDVVMMPRLVSSDGTPALGLRPAFGVSRLRETFVSDRTVRGAPWSKPQSIPLPACYRNMQTSDSTFAIAHREWRTARTIAHEIGHALMLKHELSDSLLMKPNAGGRAFTATEPATIRRAALERFPSSQLDVASKPGCTLPRQ